MWGDILTFVANQRGIAGTVIDGACRDTALAREIGYPLYSRSYSMRTGKDRVQLDATGVSVTIGQAEIAPGDILIGDTDGVIAIPQAREEEVVTLAETIFAAEERIREAVAGGKRLDQARKDEAYHLLQRRDA